MSTGTVIALGIGAGIIFVGRKFGAFCIPGIERPYGDILSSCRNIKELAKEAVEYQQRKAEFNKKWEIEKREIINSVPLPSWVSSENPVCSFDFLKLEHLPCLKG